jgi:dihydrofolate reductase
LRKLSGFIHLSLDGCYADAAGDMSFAHAGSDDPEWMAFTAANAASGGALAFGRITYEMMAPFWSSSAAFEQMPQVAERMRDTPKHVFSRTLVETHWRNTRVERDLAAGVRRLKAAEGPDITVLGSGQVLAQLIALGQLDELLVVANPVMLGAGRRWCEGVAAKVERVSCRAFANGKVVLGYRPQGR